LPPEKRGSDAATFIAVIMVLVCIGGFLLLMMSVIPGFIGVLLIPLGVGPLIFLQYLVWGRWLARLQAEDQERERREREQGANER
jgi:hypothetical protein